MNPSELRHTTQQFQIRFENSAAAPAPRTALRVYSSRDELYLEQLHSQRPLAIEGQNAAQHQRLLDCVRPNPTMLCWLAAPPSDLGALLLGLEFRSGARSDQLEFYVSEKIVTDIQKKNRFTDPRDVYLWLIDEFTIGDTAIAIELPRPSQMNIYGRGSQLEIKIVEVTGGVQYKIEKIIWRSRPLPEDAQLWQAKKISFLDSSAAASVLQDLASFSEQLSAPEAYLSLWKDYNRLEVEASLKNAREIGRVAYQRREPLPDREHCWRFFTNEDQTAFVRRIQDKNGNVCASQTAPSVITVETLPESAEFPDESNQFVGQIKESTATYIDIAEHRPDETKVACTPPNSGELYQSIQGDRTRIERREQQIKLIRSAKNPMPQLILLLEGIPVSTADQRRLKPVSSQVNKLFSGGRPNVQQHSALDVALNTPDIALIQGPPGTGKTRVIAALQTRLAEEVAPGQPMSGVMLLSSFQHEAVEHVAEATRVHGLPAMKLGKSKRDQSDYSLAIENWRSAKKQRIEGALGQLAETDLHRLRKWLRGEYELYRINPIDLNHAQTILKRVKHEASGTLSSELHDQLLGVLERLRVPQTTEDMPDLEPLRRLIGALPISPESFADDGQRKVWQLERALKNFGLKPEDRALLQRALDWQPEQSLDFVASFADLRERLLEQVAPDELPRAAQTPVADVLELLQEISAHLAAQHRASSSGAAAILEDYLQALDDPELVKVAVTDFTMVLAATCQQAVGYEMNRQKEQPVFDTVVIDEAARANPLDLLIPMSLARRRIILVGDQRQLPHMLEPNVERKLMQPGMLSNQQRAAYKDSLFARLFEQMKQLEQKDGVRRTVTLDTQYRMHPKLASFVSQQFYEPYGEGFKSVRPSEDFAHRVPGFEGKFAAWEDLPIQRGAEKSGQSKSRPAEATAVARLAKTILDECPELSVGVITFYSEQVKLLWQEFAKLGLSGRSEGDRDDEDRDAERSERNGWRVKETYRFTATGDGMQQERLRLGTVDAFQGKEFDVVILSMTRSNTLPVTATDLTGQRRKWGHLSLENRLNVAMSRQKRLLIVVGDRAMVTHAVASEAIPALVAFERLARGIHD